MGSWISWLQITPFSSVSWNCLHPKGQFLDRASPCTSWAMEVSAWCGRFAQHLAGHWEHSRIVSEKVTLAVLKFETLKISTIFGGAASIILRFACAAGNRSHCLCFEGEKRSVKRCWNLLDAPARSRVTAPLALNVYRNRYRYRSIYIHIFMYTYIYIYTYTHV